VDGAGNLRMGNRLGPDFLEEIPAGFEDLPGQHIVRMAEVAFQFYPGQEALETAIVDLHPCTTR
jgi:hypothetical protein